MTPFQKTEKEVCELTGEKLDRLAFSKLFSVVQSSCVPDHEADPPRQDSLEGLSEIFRIASHPSKSGGEASRLTKRANDGTGRFRKICLEAEIVRGQSHRDVTCEARTNAESIQ